MKKVWAVLSGLVLLGSGWLGGASEAWAVSLDFVPATQTVMLGDSVMVDLVISGLGNGVDPSVGDFDLDVTYDSSILTATGVTFGPFLGDGIDSFQDSDVLTPGLIDLAELSLLFDLSGQPGSFTLATLSFNTVGVGTSALILTQVIVEDAFAQDLSPTVGTGSITVETGGPTNPIPEPGTILLFGSGLAGLLGWRMRTR